MNDPIIGRRLFTDGVERDVHQADDGRQYVLDDWGTEVFGVWVVPEAGEDRPVVNGRRR